MGTVQTFLRHAQCETLSQIVITFLHSICSRRCGSNIFPPAARYYFSPFGWLDPSWYSANIICPIIYHATAGECIISPDFIRASSPLHNNSRTLFSLLYISHPHIFLLGTVLTHTHIHSLPLLSGVLYSCSPFVFRVQCVQEEERRERSARGKFIP